MTLLAEKILSPDDLLKALDITDTNDCTWEYFKVHTQEDMLRDIVVQEIEGTSLTNNLAAVSKSKNSKVAVVLLRHGDEFRFVYFVQEEKTDE